jgi:hypothetical protein
VSIPNLPGIGLAGNQPDPGTTATSPAGLFPTITPSQSIHASRHARPSKVAADAVTFTTSSRVDGQLAGLAALLVAIAIAVARLSLRRRTRPGKSAEPHSDAPRSSASTGTPGQLAAAKPAEASGQQATSST